MMGVFRKRGNFDININMSRGKTMLKHREKMAL